MTRCLKVRLDEETRAVLERLVAEDRTSIVAVVRALLWDEAARRKQKALREREAWDSGKGYKDSWED